MGKGRIASEEGVTFRIAVSCKVSTPKKSRATFADIHVGDIVTIGHSLDYKNNRVAMEIVVDKSKSIHP